MSATLYRGRVVDFARGYGFITTGEKIDDNSAARYFFHHSSVIGNSDSIVKGMMVTFILGRGKDGKISAMEVRSAVGDEIGFKRAANVNMNVSHPGRRVGVVAPNPSANFCFAIDQETGDKVFIPRTLVKGQQIEFTLEMDERGPMGVDVTGPMGSSLARAKPGAQAVKEEKPKAKVVPKKQAKAYYSDDEDYYDDVDWKYM